MNDSIWGRKTVLDVTKIPDILDLRLWKKHCKVYSSKIKIACSQIPTAVMSV